MSYKAYPLKRLTNKWTASQQAFLLFSFRTYDISWDDLAHIFNVVFHEQLRIRGFTRRRQLPKETVRTQYHDLCRHQTRIYLLVYIRTDFFDLEEAFPNFTKAFLVACKDLKIAVKARLSEPNESITTSKTEERRLNINGERRIIDMPIYPLLDSFSLGEVHSQISDTHSAQHKASSERLLKTDMVSIDWTTTIDSSLAITRTSAPQPIHDDSARMWTDKDSNHHGIPYLLFRVYDYSSHGVNTTGGFQAGRHAAANFSGLDDEEFLLHASNHFNRLPESTPLISLTTSFIWAICMALDRKSKHGRAVFVTIVDGRAAASATRMYEASEIVTRLKTLGYAKSIKKYKALFEYVVLNDIPNKAILGTIEITQLEALASYHCNVERLLHWSNLKKSENNKYRNIYAVWQSLEALEVDGDIIDAVVKVILLFKPDAQCQHPLVLDFLNVLGQNFNLISTTPATSIQDISILLRKAFLHNFAKPSMSLVCVEVAGKRNLPVWLFSPYV